MTTLTFQPYRRHDGELMLYINSTSGPALGVSSDRDLPAPYGRGVTAGKRNLMNATHRVLTVAGVPFTGDITTHDQEYVTLANGWILAITDTATIGGQATGADGAYLIVDGRLIPIGSSHRYSLTVLDQEV